MHRYTWGLYGKEHSARQKIAPLEWLVRVIKETVQIAEGMTKALDYLPELENKTLLLRTGHASGIGLGLMEQEQT